MEIDIWKGCYPSNWKGLIVPEAMSHPAKYSSKLIRRIYEHILAEGWVKKEDGVVDPFGGVALGALDAMRVGLNWTGIELEAKFAGLGNENIALWEKKFSQMPNWGSARLLNGDSRQLLKVIEACTVEMKSPPYGVEALGHAGEPNTIDISKKLHSRILGGAYGSQDGNLGNLKNTEFDLALSSPPFLQAEGGTPEPKPGGSIDKALYARHSAGNAKAHGYGKTEGQLSSMGDDGFDQAISGQQLASTEYTVAISSPPYTSSVQVEKNNTSIGIEKNWESYRASGGRQSFEAYKKTQEFHSQGYGHADGNLANMETADSDFELAVSSPPFEDSRSRDFMSAEARRSHARVHGISNAEFVTPIDLDRLKAPDDIYGDTDGQLGNDSGDSFWLAARQIVDQVYAALKPGGHAVWVTKGYIKNKKYVDFPDQWRQLCEAAGFESLHEHRAMLVHHKGTSQTLDGGLVEHKTESKSFFRRLAEKKGSPRIDWETVFCMVKPLAVSDQLLAGGSDSATPSQTLVVSSPPYADSINSESHGIDWTKAEKDYPGRQMTPTRIASHDKNHQMRKYGETPGQLGGMKDSAFESALHKGDTD